MRRLGSDNLITFRHPPVGYPPYEGRRTFCAFVNDPKYEEILESERPRATGLQKKSAGKFLLWFSANGALSVCFGLTSGSFEPFNTPVVL